MPANQFFLKGALPKRAGANQCAGGKFSGFFFTILVWLQPNGSHSFNFARLMANPVTLRLQ